MITINPENPSSDNPVVFEFVVAWNGCCVLTKSVDGSQFYFEMVPIDPPPPVISTHIPLEISRPVGRLEAGDYQVTLNDNWGDPETLAFSVSQGVLPFPEPTIPALGFAGTILLATALLWVAHKALKRTPESAA